MSNDTFQMSPCHHHCHHTKKWQQQGLEMQHVLSHSIVCSYLNEKPNHLTVWFAFLEPIRSHPLRQDCKCKRIQFWHDQCSCYIIRKQTWRNTKWFRRLEDWRKRWEENIILQGKELCAKGWWDILKMYHDHETARHPGELETYNVVKHQFWWLGLCTFVKNYLKGVCYVFHLFTLLYFYSTFFPPWLLNILSARTHGYTRSTIVTHSTLIFDSFTSLSMTPSLLLDLTHTFLTQYLGI